MAHQEKKLPLIVPFPVTHKSEEKRHVVEQPVIHISQKVVPKIFEQPVVIPVPKGVEVEQYVYQDYSEEEPLEVLYRVPEVFEEVDVETTLFLNNTPKFVPGEVLNEEIPIHNVRVIPEEIVDKTQICQVVEEPVTVAVPMKYEVTKIEEHFRETRGDKREVNGGECPVDVPIAVSAPNRVEIPVLVPKEVKVPRSVPNYVKGPEFRKVEEKDEVILTRKTVPRVRNVRSEEVIVPVEKVVHRPKFKVCEIIKEIEKEVYMEVEKIVEVPYPVYYDEIIEVPVVRERKVPKEILIPNVNYATQTLPDTRERLPAKIIVEPPTFSDAIHMKSLPPIMMPPSNYNPSSRNMMPSNYNPNSSMWFPPPQAATPFFSSRRIPNPTQSTWTPIPAPKNMYPAYPISSTIPRYM